jgi:hypothetical protein
MTEERIRAILEDLADCRTRGELNALLGEFTDADRLDPRVDEAIKAGLAKFGAERKEVAAVKRVTGEGEVSIRVEDLERLLKLASANERRAATERESLGRESKRFWFLCDDLGMFASSQGTIANQVVLLCAICKELDQFSERDLFAVLDARNAEFTTPRTKCNPHRAREVWAYYRRQLIDAGVIEEI